MPARRHIETQGGLLDQATAVRCLGERFRAEALVGGGGMGIVYRCRDLLDGGMVAVKVLQRLEYIAVERFAREAEVLASLIHPGIVRYVAHGMTGQGEPYLAMEWLDGETLADRIGRGPIPAAAAARFGAKVLQALAAAHGSGVVHRDIKPSNLFLPGADLDRVKLLDFGIARRPHDERQITQPGAGIGTPLYMAPEQYREGSGVDGRADLFSLGCVVFECVTGDPPRLIFDRDGRAFACAWNPATLAVLREGLAQPLRDVLARMLALSPEERPSDEEKLVLELGQAALALAGSGSDSGRLAKARTLSGNEQRMAAVMAVSGISGAGEEAARFGALTTTLRLRGAKLDRTASGLWTLAMVGRGIPGDLVGHAARLGLRVQSTFAKAGVAIASSRADLEDEAALARLGDKAAGILVLAPAATVCVDPGAAHLLEARFELDALLEGIFRLRFERDIREVPRTLMGKDIPCFGREREISFVEDLWQDACEGGSACVLVLTAPPGGGKSRVRDEFCQGIEGRRPFLLLLGRGDPMHDAAPFALLGPALLAAAGNSGEEPELVQRERLLARIARVLPGEPGRRTAAFLGEMASLPFPDDDLPGLRAARKDARVMADQRLAAWLDWLETECAQQPVLLVLEDLHWADGPSVSFVDAALRVLAQKPFMVLALARPEVDRRFPNLWAARNPQRISLGPLSTRASQRMVAHVAGPIPEASSRWIVDRAQGNPFFLQELLRVVAGGGQVGDDSDLPDTVLGMVQARLDGFGPEAKLVLRAGSVFGEWFQAGGVKALLDQEQRKDVDKWLDILEEQEVVFCRRGSELREYAFRHALFRQAAYELLPPEEKRLGHLLAGRFLAQTGERDGSVLADHFERGGDHANAVTWLVVAAEQALDANEVAEALARAEKAVRLGATGEELCGLKLTEARALYWKGEYPGSEAAARVALGTKQERRRLLAVTALLDALGPQAKYAEIADEQRRLVRPQEPELLNLWLESMAAAAAYLSRGVDPANSEQILALLEQERKQLDPLLVGRYELLKANAARAEGLLSDAIRCLRCAADHYESIGLPLDSCVATGNLASALGELGQLEQATERVRRILGIARKMDMKHLLGGCLQMLANVLACQGLLDEARAAGLEARAVTRAHNDRRFQGSAEAYLSVTEHLAGDFALAESYARDAMATWEPVPLARPFAVALLARALVAQGRADQGLAHAREAYALLEKLGDVDDGEATIRLALAECLLATGDGEAGRDAVASATRWLRARAGKIDDPAHRESFLSRIPEHRRILELARAP